MMLGKSIILDIIPTQKMTRTTAMSPMSPFKSYFLGPVPQAVKDVYRVIGLNAINVIRT